MSLLPFWQLFFFLSFFLFFLRRKLLPNPVFLPGKSHGQRSLAGYNPWGHEESDTTWQLSNKNKNCFYRSFSFPSSFALFSLDSVSKFTAVFGFLLLCEVFYCRFFCSQLPWHLYISVYKQDCFKFVCFFCCLFVLFQMHFQCSVFACSSHRYWFGYHISAQMIYYIYCMFVFTSQLFH